MKTRNRCNAKRFQQDFPNWTSGNIYIDNFIQESQLNAQRYSHVLEWIPYNRLTNIKYLAKGGFSTVYKAIWLDGRIYLIKGNVLDIIMTVRIIMVMK